MKHGPFALLGKDTPVIAIVARDSTYDAMINNIREIKTREAPVIAISAENNGELKHIADYIINVPDVDYIFSPVVNAVALQLLAYYTARERAAP